MRVLPALALATALASCGAAPSDTRTLIARSWTCESTTAADGLSATLHEDVTFSPSGAYASSGRIDIRQGDTRGEIRMAWAGTWGIASGLLTRKLDTFEARDGVINGAPLSSGLLAQAAGEFRRDMISEEAEVISVDDKRLELKTDSGSMTCRAT